MHKFLVSSARLPLAQVSNNVITRLPVSGQATKKGKFPIEEKKRAENGGHLADTIVNEITVPRRRSRSETQSPKSETRGAPQEYKRSTIALPAIQVTPQTGTNEMEVGTRTRP